MTSHLCNELAKDIINRDTMPPIGEHLAPLLDGLNYDDLTRLVMFLVLMNGRAFQHTVRFCETLDIIRAEERSSTS